MTIKGLTSIIIPVYNESAYILTTIQKCLQLPMDNEMIVVDNNSTDSSYSLVREFIRDRELDVHVKLYKAPKQGKGNAIKVGLSHAKGEYIVMHDADLEYDPIFIPELVKYLDKHAAVHGCRVCRPYAIGVFPFLANKLILHMLCRRYKTTLNDIFTGQRAYTKSALSGMKIESNGFDLETELTIKALHGGLSIKEIDVTYKPRTRQEGKHIGFMDFIDIVVVYAITSQKLERERKRKPIGAVS